MKNQVNLLVIEDNPADSDLICEYLLDVPEFEANIHCVQTLKEGKAYLSENRVHAVLLDLSLPDSRGLDTVREVISMLDTGTAIILTSLDDKEVAMKAIESGAQDFLLKSTIGPEALSRVIRFSLQRSKWHEKMNDMQTKLYQSQKLESIGRLAGGIAHDFNNQLAMISLLNSLCRKKLDKDHPIQEYIEQIDTVARQSVSLTKRLLAFSRIQPVDPKVVDINDVITESEGLLRNLLDKDIDIKVSLDKSAFICIDPGLMAQVLMNLALNARDSMPEGGTLIMETQVKENSDFGGVGQVTLRVSDTGCGMEKNIIEKIFEPFYTTKEIGKGTGLGLSMVLGTIKQFGGDVRVESVAGKGTVFNLIFPLFEKEDVGEECLIDNQGSSRNVLIVDDELPLLELMRQILEEENFKVSIASNGIEALDLIEKNDEIFDLLITDLNMPKMGGFELSEKIRVEIPGIKVIFTSGYMLKLPKELEESKHVEYMAKPILLDDLLKKVEELLS